MGSLPLHPAVVHLPIGLAMLAPILSLLGALAVIRGRTSRGQWATLALVQALVLAGALVAQRTGHDDEDRVERVVSESVIEVHEERGEVFVWIAAGALAASCAAVALPAGTAGVVAALVATASSVVVAGAAYWVGHSGGELVYQHGAASAWARGAADPALARRRHRD